MQEEKKVTVAVKANVSNEGAVAFSLNPKVAKKEWKLNDGEVIAVKASKVLVLDETEKKGWKKGEWYLTMTNQRFVISKVGNRFWDRMGRGLAMSGGALTALLYGLVSDSLTKGIPVYAIPFQSIVSCNLEGSHLTVTTKDGNTFGYRINTKEKQFARQIQQMFG